MSCRMSAEVANYDSAVFTAHYFTLDFLCVSVSIGLPAVLGANDFHIKQRGVKVFQASLEIKVDKLKTVNHKHRSLGS